VNANHAIVAKTFEGEINSPLRKKYLEATNKEKA